MNLIEITKNCIEEVDKKKNEERNKEAFYISDAGKCRRQMYYSLEFKKPLESNSAESVLRMDAGKRIEEAIVDYWKEQGILVDGQTRVEEALTDKHEIHGYADAIIKDGEARHIPVEIKSFYGYHQAKDLRDGKPKPEYVYQLALYMHFLGYNRGKLLYIDRSDMSMFEFDVFFDENGNIMYSTEFEQEYAEKSIKQLLADMKFVSASLSKEEVPYPDFQYKYSLMDFTADADTWSKSKLDAEIKKMRPINQIKEGGKVAGYSYSGTLYPKKDDAIVAFLSDAQHGILPTIDSVVGDWNCKYCDYKSHCLDSQGVSLGYDHTEYMDRLEALLQIRKGK